MTEIQQTRVGFDPCQPLFFCFRLKITSQPPAFLESFLPASLISMPSSRGRVPFILKRKTRLMPSLCAHSSSAFSQFHISVRSDLFPACVWVCARACTHVPSGPFLAVPVDKACYLCAAARVSERIRTSQTQPGEKDVLVHF